MKTRVQTGLSAIIDRLYRRKTLLLVLFLLFLIALPAMGVKTSFKRIVISAMIYAILGLSLNITTGYTGLVSLGHAAYYSIGAFTSAILSTRFGLNFLPCLLVSILTAAIAGILVGLPSLRLTGSYLCIVTLGFAEVVRAIELWWEPVTNGTRGIRDIPAPKFFGLPLTVRNDGAYYLILLMLILVSLLCYLLIRSKIGRGLICIKEDERAAIMMGIHPFRYKMTAFVFSAALAGLAGGLYSFVIGYIDPYTFTFDTSITILCIVILGGMATMRGMYLGAIVLIFMPELLRGFDTWRFVIYGLLLVLMMRFRPQGILGWQSRRPYRLPRGVEPNAIEGTLNQKGGSTGGTTGS